MDELNSMLKKLLTSTVTIQVFSNPHFCIEVFFAILFATLNILLLLELNKIFNDIIINNVTKIRIKNSLRASESKESYCTSVAQIKGRYYTFNESKSVYSQFRKVERSFSKISNDWLMPNIGDSIFLKRIVENKPKIDRIDALLSITPSEYVRLDKEKRLQDNHVRECIESLTKVLEYEQSAKSKEILNNNKLGVVSNDLSSSIVSNNEYPKKGPECLVDQTLYDMMENIVMSSSIEAPEVPKNYNAYLHKKNVANSSSSSKMDNQSASDYSLTGAFNKSERTTEDDSNVCYSITEKNSNVQLHQPLIMV